MRCASFIARFVAHGALAVACLAAGTSYCLANPPAPPSGTAPAYGTTAANGTSAANGTAPDPLVAMFVWWNAAYKQKDGFTAESFARYFTTDAVMRINGRDRSRGVADLAKHFRDIQASTEMVAIELPFIDEFVSAGGDRIFTHHIVVAREHGKDSRERVMGYATIQNGKIALLNFVSIADPE